MKILTSSLFTTIAFFLHFCESNAVIMNHNQHGDNPYPPTRKITYKRRSFAVWETPAGSLAYRIRLEPVDYLEDEVSYIVPQDITIEYVVEPGAQFVVIREPRGIFLGAQAGKISPEPPGSPSRVIDYAGNEIGVWRNRATGVIYEVRLLSENFVPFSAFTNHRYFRTHLVYNNYGGGFWFLVHEIHRKVLGAELSHTPSAQ
ncbi:uncharacterized protein LOC117175190 [Belonocnema kinseyi]|uniref:uncharacterized protein LOC117175190 n=1 Tax=Belonocnema kinseyi TaxID=2817044 RepID=UPI00143D2931|nr:uncharacterized protein LOC117175190 [Belonocnema kinseyi]